jgi:hypothetical protein
MMGPSRRSLKGTRRPREQTHRWPKNWALGFWSEQNVIATKEPRRGSILRIRIKFTALPGREDARQVLRGVVTVQLKLFLKIIEFLIR